MENNNIKKFVYTGLNNTLGYDLLRANIFTFVGLGGIFAFGSLFNYVGEQTKLLGVVMMVIVVLYSSIVLWSKNKLDWESFKTRILATSFFGLFFSILMYLISLVFLQIYNLNWIKYNFILGLIGILISFVIFIVFQYNITNNKNMYKTVNYGNPNNIYKWALFGSVFGVFGFKKFISKYEDFEKILLVLFPYILSVVMFNIFLLSTLKLYFIDKYEIKQPDHFK